MTVIRTPFDTATRTLRWGRAGHLPPVLVRRGSAEALPVPHGLLLTAAGRPVDSLDDFLDHLLARSGADTDDDTCLVGIQPT